MAYDKVVDSAALDAAMTYTANRIRNKTGGTDQIAWDSAKGFGDAVDAITTGSSAPESDPREVYGGTRPAEWLRLPDYDKVEQNTVYFLFELSPYETNMISLMFRTDGIATIKAGVVSNGEFIPFENDDVVSMQGQLTTWETISRTFNYADYGTAMSDGTKQIVVQFQTSTGLNRVAFAGSSQNSSLENRGVRDIIIHKEFGGEGYHCFNQGVLQRGCLYYYAIGAYSAKYPVSIRTLMYAQHAEGVVFGSMANSTALVKILGTCKKENGATNEFTNCYALTELTLDISEWTTRGNLSLNACNSLRKLLFTNCETMTSVPSNLELSNTALGADAVLAFFNTLPDISTSDTRTITLKSTPAVAEGISEATLAVATNKGWTVVTS